MATIYLLLHGGAPISVHNSVSDAYGEAEAIDDVDEFSLLRLEGEYIELCPPEDDDAEPWGLPPGEAINKQLPKD